MRTRIARVALLSIVATFALGLTSCAAPPLKVQLGGNRDVNITQWKTWSWAPNALPASERASGIALIDGQIRTTTASVLAEKGLRMVPSRQADAWLDYALDVQRIGRPDGDGGFDVATHGTLMIKMRDAKSDRIGWLGTASGIPRDMETLQDRQALAKRVTRRLLRHFPDRR